MVRVDRLKAVIRLFQLNQLTFVTFALQMTISSSMVRVDRLTVVVRLLQLNRLTFVTFALRLTLSSSIVRVDRLTVGRDTRSRPPRSETFSELVEFSQILSQ